ncbi:hypothetical protein BDW22DRAFT_1311178, partial [Trametopsis cervina]
RPTEYLRHRCPLCFGGTSQLAQIVNYVVCLDANFTQKRCRRKGESAQRHVSAHPNSVFVPEDEVRDMEIHVDSIRRGEPIRGKDNKPDEYEGDMRVPASVLNDCNDSFIAADEHRQKASMKYFADTGLMALLC